ncbi:MAG: adenylyl-sulfate kinase [Opitutus sp.]|nr:adenylyl-sulfate kinase [Opitutus sp.]
MAGHAQVFWLFGLSGAGKSTLACGLAAALRAEGRAVLALDGDRLREGLCAGLGYSDAARAENLRRAAEVARLATESGLTVVAAFITPREENRATISRIIGPDRLRFVHVTAPLEVCRARDAKGLYARQAAGQLPDFTGISSAFESPAQTHLALDTSAEPPAVTVTRLLAFARAELR